MSWSEQERNRIFSRTSGRCAYCGRAIHRPRYADALTSSFAPGDWLVDQWVPGHVLGHKADDGDNLWPACCACHDEKAQGNGSDYLLQRRVTGRAVHPAAELFNDEVNVWLTEKILCLPEHLAAFTQSSPPSIDLGEISCMNDITNHLGNIPATAGGARILLIDDDPTYSKLACTRLERAGHRVSYHPGSFGVLGAIRREPFDVILVDMLMPYIDGPRLLDVMRKRALSQARLVLVSAAAENEVQSAAENHGADLHFCKRWGLDRLADLVDGVAPTR